MMHLIFEIENESDIETMLAFANKLNIKHCTSLSKEKDIPTEVEYRNRLKGIKKYEGKLSNYKPYTPLKSEFYNQ